ncbi:unnamed protein product [Notodromas monacha]|nr:unnamed protein product [Notodromas monacha]CAG0917678.1 unnamed protein product [Notodromas monacha]
MKIGTKQLRNFKVLFLLAVAFTMMEAKQKSYKGYSIIRALPRNDQDIKYLADFRSTTTEYVFLQDGISRESVDILSPPIYNIFLKAKLSWAGIPHKVLMSNVQKIIDKAPTTEPGGTMGWTSYHRLQDIFDWMDELAAANTFVKIEIIGQSHEGRDLKVLKINTANSPVKFWIDGGIHAREWITPATVTYIINEMVNNYEANKDIVDAYQWHFLPVHNPDGYEYSHTNDRLWRKTRQNHNSPSGCIGADPNRNWDFHWMEPGASGNKCSEIYAGPSPFSEPCARLVADYILRLNQDKSLLAFVTIHSYSQLWMTPFGYNETYPENYADMERVGRKGMDALTASYGTVYQFGITSTTIYITSGSSSDWAYGVAKVPYVYALELRDTGELGFLLPEDQIIPTAKETWFGIKAAAKEILA